MLKKLLPSVLFLGCLILVPLNANAAFTCNATTLAGSFSGIFGGTNFGNPFSSFIFLNVLSNGTVTILEIFSQNGIPWQQQQGTGVWSPFFTTQGFCILQVTVLGGPSYLANVIDNANTILVSSPNHPNTLGTGTFRRSGF